MEYGQSRIHLVRLSHNFKADSIFAFQMNRSRTIQHKNHKYKMQIKATLKLCHGHNVMGELSFVHITVMNKNEHVGCQYSQDK